MTRARALALLLPLALAGTALAAPAAGAQTATPTRYVLPGDDVFPEGITASGDTFYVTSTTDGTVFRGDVDEPRTRPFLQPGRDGRTTAVGLEVTPAGDRLVVAGGATGDVWVYDTSDGSLLRRYTNGGPGAGPTFINDVAIAPNGDAYLTDSQRPVMYRIPAKQLREGTGRTQPLQVYRDFTGTAFRYVEGFNANGIVVTPDGRYAVVVQSQTGLLFRIGLRDGGTIVQISLHGQRVTAGDGLELAGDTLYVVRNAFGRIAEVQLSADRRYGVLESETTAPSLRFPTTAVIARDRLLVVNSQFDKRGGEPETPFTVSSLEVP